MILSNISGQHGASVVKNNPQPPLQPGDPQAMTDKPIACDVSGCPQPAISWMDFRFLCIGHLVSHCYDRLEELEHAGTARPTELQSGFLDECSARIAALLVTHTALENLERARLLDILLWANELDRKRRSSRFPI